MSYVIGIDPSITSTGVCVLHNDKNPRFHTVGTVKKRSIDNGGDMPLGLRLWHLRCAIATCIPPNTTPLLVAIEAPISPLAVNRAMGGSGFNTNIMAYAMAYEMCGSFRIPYVEFSPQQRAMIATGKGNSNKQDVCDAYHEIIKGEASNNNEIDAYWLAMGAAEVLANSKTSRMTPYGGWLDLADHTYTMLEAKEIQRP